jgi:Gpi18-like mannosyltransferase
LERSFLSPWLRWDAVWYQRIITQGYSATDGTSQFHPLYPWLATPLARIGFSPTFSLLIISSLAGLALFYFFYKLALLDLQPPDAFFATILLVLAPPAFVLFAPYPEALFILFAVLCLYFARKKSWWLSSLMGGLAVLTRQQGIFLLLPVAWELWENENNNRKSILSHWKNWLSLSLIPMGYGVWLIYRAIFLFDLQAKLGDIQQFRYSFLISPSATQVVQIQQFLWPWQALYLSIMKGITNPDLDIWLNIISGLFFLILLYISWRRMRLSYRIYCAFITLVSFSYYTGPVHPYMGLPRHLLLAFPIFIGLAEIIVKPWVRLLIIVTSSLAMSFLLVTYVLNAWVP